MRVLVTGFEPFGGEKINPSMEAVRILPETVGGKQVIPLEVPVVRGKSLEVIMEAVRKWQPERILSVGQAGGRCAVTVERIGINVDDFRIPDNEGNQPADEKIFPEGPDAYLVSLPVRKMVEHIRAAGIPAALSNTAGTYVCNHVLYGVRYLLEQEGRGRKNGFIHIPYLPEQTLDKTGQPSMALSDIVKGLTAAIEAL